MAAKKKVDMDAWFPYEGSNKLDAVIDEVLACYSIRLNEEFPNKTDEMFKGALIELAATAGCEIMIYEKSTSLNGVRVDDLIPGRGHVPGNS